MKHGELSNTVGYSFGFRCEDFLVHFKDATLVDKALNALFDKAKRAEVNEEVCSIMEYLYRNTEYTVDVVVDRENYTEAMKELYCPRGQALTNNLPIDDGRLDLLCRR